LNFASIWKKTCHFLPVDVDASTYAKFGEHVTDAGMYALRSLLLVHSMEKKHVTLEGKYKKASKDVKKFKHKEVVVEERMKDTLDGK